MRTLTISTIIFWTGAAFAVDAAPPAAIPTPVAAPLARPAVTVLPFADASPGAGSELPPVPGAAFDVEAPMPWLADGVPAALEFTLERAAAVNLVARKDFAFALKKRKDQDLTPATPAEVLAEVAAREGLTHYVSGAVNKNKKDLSFNVEVYAAGGAMVGKKEFVGKIDGVFPLVTEAAKFVIAQAGGGEAAGLIPREPTGSLEAFMWYSRGASRLFTGERITFMLHATQKDPKFAEAHLALADAYRAEKDYGSAQTAYEQARTLADYYASAPVGLAQTLRKLEPDNKDGATVLCNEALAIDPSCAPAYDCLGSVYSAASDYEKARAAYEKYVEIWPSSRDGYYALGNMLWLMGKDSPQWKSVLQSAIDNYNKALAVDPDFAACHYNIASLYKIFENVDKATFHYRRYIDLEPNAPNRKEIEETIAEWEKKYGKK